MNEIDIHFEWLPMSDKIDRRIERDYPFTVFAPKTQSVLHITPSFQIDMITPKPNRWHRFLYRVLLGWTWTDVK